MTSSTEPAALAQPPTTGLPALDAVLAGLRPGDNVVWQVERVEDYARLVRAFVTAAPKPVTYFRFARHRPLLAEGDGVAVHVLDPAAGFETFTAAIHRAIAAAGRGAHHVFDCLSDLAAGWHSDLMLASFFTVTCPYLASLDTIAYFALLRDAHAPSAVDDIRDTTQVLADVFHHRAQTLVHPVKVQDRRSPTMYLPHHWEGAELVPLTESARVAEALAEASDRRLDPASGLDVWDRRFLRARQVEEGVRAGHRPPGEEQEAFRSLLRMVLTRDERFAALAERYLELRDLFDVRQRMIGTGLVGGKAAGMLVARAILTRTDPSWRGRLEPHDSWFIGSDVFYTYLVRNGLWHTRRQRRPGPSLLEGTAEARERILAGTFPEAIRRQLETMLAWYGQSPIIVRSSSLLEDGFGNAFTGKYESVFCPNQGSPEERLEAVLRAIKTVYASALGEDALRYRDHRGLLERDEQMAVLVQRVSGAVHGRWFYPQVAGVALSFNPWVWNAAIDPRAGVLRLVFGLGTRAVERVDDDYTRLVALNAPRLRPQAAPDDGSDGHGGVDHAQTRVDVLDLERNELVAVGVDEVVAGSPRLPVDLVAAPRAGGRGYTLTFERLLWGTPFVTQVRDLLATLQGAYRYPVDVELTANYLESGELKVNLVQCRPLQVKEGGLVHPAPRGLREADVFLRSRGPVVGQSTCAPIDRVIDVDADVYATLGTQARYEVARVVGRVARTAPPGALRILLLGPGRWGTGTPSLGVPVAFAEIQRVAAMCEVMSLGGHVPDVSLGSHFFNDLVEADMLYLALHPGYPGHHLDRERLRQATNRLTDLLPDDGAMAGVVRVVDFPQPGDPRLLWLHADTMAQEVIAYLDEPASG